MAFEIHSSTQNGITWQVHLRPDLSQHGAQHVVEFRKHGKRGKLLDQVIGWQPAGWCQMPSTKIPKYLLEQVGQILQRLQADASRTQPPEAAEVPAVPATPEPAALSPLVPVLAFPSFLSAQLLAQHCPGYLARHSAPGI